MEILKIFLFLFMLFWFGWNITTLVVVHIKNNSPVKNRRVAKLRRQRVVMAWANITAMSLIIVLSAVILNVVDKRVTEKVESDATINSAASIATDSITEDSNVEPVGNFEDSINSDQKKEINPSVSASYIYVYDADLDEEIYGKSEDAQIAPASTTKLLTALTVLKHCNVDEIVEVGDELNYVAPDSSKAWIEYGDSISVYDLLVGLLLPSGNDAAYVLAVHSGKKICGESEEVYVSTQEAINAFVAEMNNVATEIGANKSNFMTPDGYDEAGQYTTAKDLCTIAEKCLDNQTIMGIVGDFYYESYSENGSFLSYVSSNYLLDDESEYYYPGVTGMKTGTSDAAGGCIISSVEINGTTYICVVMNGTDEGRWEDTLSIYSELEGY